VTSEQTRTGVTFYCAECGEVREPGGDHVCSISFKESHLMISRRMVLIDVLAIAFPLDGNIPALARSGRFASFQAIDSDHDGSRRTTI